MAESFSQKVKTQLAAVEVRKKCCLRTESDLGRARESGWGAAALSDIWNRCRCEGCRAVFFRTLFRAAGSVTDPAKSYQLDLSFSDRETAEAVRETAREAGFSFGLSFRRGKSVIYLRESGAVEDFLAFLGATAASFYVMNAKIDREFRGNANRLVNFDTANIEKQLRAVRKYTEAAEKLKAAGKYDLLPEEVRLTGELRAANEQLTFEDLGKLHVPPISKSGVKHRLEKILKAAEELGETDGGSCPK